MAGESLKVVVLFTTRIIGAVAIGDVRTSWRREAGVVVTYGVCTLCKLGNMQHWGCYTTLYKLGSSTQLYENNPELLCVLIPTFLF